MSDDKPSDLRAQPESGVSPPVVPSSAAEPSVLDALEPTCPGQAEGAGCWMELSNHPGCQYWNGHYRPGQSVTWTGGCSNGLASGAGTLRIVLSGAQAEFTGFLEDGVFEGRCVVRVSNGDIYEGPVLNGLQHGHWVGRYKNGDVREGPLVDAVQHGRWVER